MAGVDGSLRQHGGKQAESPCSVEMLDKNLEVQFVLTCRGKLSTTTKTTTKRTLSITSNHFFQGTCPKRVLLPSLKLAVGCCSCLWH